MRIVPIACLTDNYAYLIVCELSRDAVVVDPSEAAPVEEAIMREGVRLRAIWNTHHHPDHVGGNQALLARYGDLEVAAHESDRGRVPGQTRFCADGDRVAVGSIAAEIIHNPGHTRGAVSYHIPSDPAVFSGDTLFGAGCGRLFEGTADEMYVSLRKLAQLPEPTRVFCGHEYAEKNLAFAAEAEPDNQEVTARRRRVAELRSRGQPSVPSTIAEERATNPFIRAGSAEKFAELRSRRNRF